MLTTIAATAVVHPRVALGDDSIVDDFVILGGNIGAGSDDSLRIGREARIRSHTVIYAGNVIGDRFQTGHGVLVRESNEIGSNVSVGSHSVVEHHVSIGDGVRIHSNAFIPEFTVIEHDAWIGPSVSLTNARYPRSRNVHTELAGPIIREHARIGANATLLPGVIIGRNALVGAGAVVVRDVPDGAVVVGNPARITRMVDEIGAYANA